MTEAELIDLSCLPSFPATARELMRVAGTAATAQLIGAWRGQVFPVPMRVGGGSPRGARRWAQLEEVVGHDAAARIVKHWAGQRLQVPNLKTVMWSRARDQIRADFDRLTGREGYSSPEAVFELGLKYNVSGKAIEDALRQPDNVRTAPDGQGRLF
jgi:hypothetical protein